MRANEQEWLCTKLMRALFWVFVGSPSLNINCFNKCVRECYRTNVLWGGKISAWRGYAVLINALRNSEVRTRRESGVYGCPKAVTLMTGLARLCVIEELPKKSVVFKQMCELKTIEHARTIVIHNNKLGIQQSFLWVKRESLSAPEEKNGDEIESSADHCNNMADDESNMEDNEGSGAGNGSGTTDIGSGGANNDSGN